MAFHNGCNGGEDKIPTFEVTQGDKPAPGIILDIPLGKHAAVDIQHTELRCAHLREVKVWMLVHNSPTRSLPNLPSLIFEASEKVVELPEAGLDGIQKMLEVGVVLRCVTGQLQTFDGLLVLSLKPPKAEMVCGQWSFRIRRCRPFSLQLMLEAVVIPLCCSLSSGQNRILKLLCSLRHVVVPLATTLVWVEHIQCRRAVLEGGSSVTLDVDKDAGWVPSIGAKRLRDWKT